MDELADPQYIVDPYKDPYFPRAFVSSCLGAADSGVSFIPETLEQELHCTRSLLWAASMRDEINSIIEYSTWCLVPVPKDSSKVIQGRLVYRTKLDVKPMFYKILFSLAAALDLDIEQMDVKTAFPNCPIEEDTFLEHPHGFEIASPDDSKLMDIELFGQKSDVANGNFVLPRPKRTNVKLI